MSDEIERIRRGQTTGDPADIALLLAEIDRGVVAGIDAAIAALNERMAAGLSLDDEETAWCVEVLENLRNGVRT